MSPSVNEVILHCQKQIKKDKSEDRLLHYIGRLSRLRIGTDDLISTGIGRTINQLSREKGIVGKKAYALVTQWKALVEAERSSDTEVTSEDDVPQKSNKRQDTDDEEDSSGHSESPRRPEPVLENDDSEHDDEDEPALFIDQAEPEPVKVKREPSPEPEVETPRKRRSDSKEREHKVKKVKTEEKSPEKKPDYEYLKPKLAPRLNVEIDSTSGVNFSDVLSGLDSKRLIKKPQKKLTPTKNNVAATSVSSITTISPDKKPATGSMSSKTEKEKHKADSLPRKVAKVAPLNYAPPPSTSKKPAADVKVLEDLAADDGDWEERRGWLNGNAGHRNQGNDDALATMMSSRNQRTKVYSGVKAGHDGKIPTLFKMCLTVVQDNIDLLEDTGGVPFEILEPVLRRITLAQLIHVEHYNPYLIEFTDDIWKYHCQQNFRGKTRDEMETWRELYYRCVDERAARFESLTSKLKTKLEDATPMRKAKLAYVEGNTKGTKFSKSKAATIKTGMSSLKIREEKGAGRGQGHSSSASSGGGGNSNTNIVIEPAAVIITGNGRSRTGVCSSSRESVSAPKKPKKAPLMQKTLKSMKTLMRR